MYQDGARRCFFEKNKRTLKKSLSVQPLGMVRLRHYRIIQRVWIGAKICAAKGAKPQEYFVYCKVLQRICGANWPPRRAWGIVR